MLKQKYNISLDWIFKLKPARSELLPLYKLPLRVGIIVLDLSTGLKFKCILFINLRNARWGKK